MSLRDFVFKRRRLYSELSDEIAVHLEEKTAELMAQGMSREEASAAARRSFGNALAMEETGREVWRWRGVDSTLADVRYAFRQFRKEPVFTLVAVAVLAIGIGGNTAVFSVLDKLLFQPLPFRAPERLVWIINEDTPGLSGRTSTVATYEALAKAASFEEITTYEAFYARSSYKLSNDNLEPGRVAGVMVPPNFFPFLGVQPQLGRTFTAEECKQNGPGAVLLTHGLWERRYASDPRIIGRQIAVNDRSATVVGVLPQAFDFGAVFAPGMQIDIFMPVVFDTVRNWGNTLAIVGRLAPGVSMGQAQAEANAIIERQQRERPEFGGLRSYGAILKPLEDSVVGGIRRPMLTLWVAIGFVLLIVCVNVANLLIARAAARSRELALRSAIGAGRLRLIRQLLTESVLLAAMGGTLGVMMSFAAVGYVRRMQGLSIPLLNQVEVSGTALAVAACLSMATALIFGIVPAYLATASDPIESLKVGSRAVGGDHHRLRSSLVVCQVALACLLVVAAGLMLRSFFRVLDVNLGYSAEQIYTLRADPGMGDRESIEKQRAYLLRLMDAAAKTPGVDAASMTDAVPLDANRTWTVRRRDQAPDQSTPALVKVVGPGLLNTMQTPLLAGREFTERDNAASPMVAMVNSSLARALWPGQDPLNQVLMIGGRERRVVGVVADVRHLSIEEPSGPEFYTPVLQMGTSSPYLVVRTRRPFADVAPGLRAALAGVAPSLPLSGFRPVRQLVDRTVSARRFLLTLLTSFAGTALFLAAIGIYGVISYSVTRRTPEIGVRMALGASSGRIRSGIVQETVNLAAAGAAIGVLGAAVVSTVVSSLLFGISPRDPWTYAAAVVTLLLIALLAGLIPAVRAARVSPMIALRAE